MADNTPEVGDKVIHHGRLHEVTEIELRPALNANGNPVAVEVIHFENDRYHVKTADVDDFQFSKADDAWYLTGRVLSRNERALHEAVTGVWPAAHSHLTARRYLDAIDFDEVDTDDFRERLASVIRRRKADVPAGEEEAYIDDLLAQCRELKELRS